MAKTHSEFCMKLGIFKKPSTKLHIFTHELCWFLVVNFNQSHIATSQSQTADFTPSAALWQTLPNTVVALQPYFILGCLPIGKMAWKHDVIHKTGRTKHITKNFFVKFGHVVFKLCEQTDKQMHKQTNKHTHHGTSQPCLGNASNNRC